MLWPLAKIASFCLPYGYKEHCFAGDTRARIRFASPAFGARQPFVLCWLSASLTIRLTTFWQNACVAILLKSLESQVTPELLSVRR